MLTFTYTAHQTESGAIVKAEVQAESERAAAKLLVSQGLFPIDIEIKGSDDIMAKLGLGERIPGKDRVIFTRQLSTLINAGLPLTESLRTAQEQVNSKPLQTVVAQIVTSVESGVSMSAAFAEHPKVFNQIYISLVAAGEASGSLDKALERIANQQEKDAAIASKLRGALIYPVIVLGVIFAVLVFMLTSVLPQIAGLYQDLKQPLPWYTQIMVNVSNAIMHYWWAMVLVAAVVFFLTRSWARTDSGRSNLDAIKLKLPIFGNIYAKVYMARFSRTLGTMIMSGIPMLEGLRIVRDSIGNMHVAAVVDEAIMGVKGGKALSSMLENKPNFLKLVPQMIKIGERSGAIDGMLDRVALYYEGEVDEEVANISTTMEPLLMVVLGVVVGGVIAGILLPVYGLVGSGGINNLN
ncbi:type II secretion system F family protein [Candidatus Saccharibacteria bacterium]|nr:type II secretion system F family protein [Candidatus Saccharibacteria bacterium]